MGMPGSPAVFGEMAVPTPQPLAETVLRTGPRARVSAVGSWTIPAGDPPRLGRGRAGQGGRRLRHRTADDVEYLGAGLVEGGLDEGSGCALVPAATELAGNPAAIQVAAAAEAEFDPAGALFDEDHRELGSVDGEGHVDEVLAVAGQRSAGVEIFEGDPGVDQPAAEFDLGPGEDPAGEIQPRERLSPRRVLCRSGRAELAATSFAASS